MQGKSIEASLTDLKPLKWRHAILRMICTATGTDGNDLRGVWQKMYRGDMRWGIRDVRLKFQTKQSRKKCFGQDRNSWIAASLRKSFLSDKKTSDKDEKM